MINKIRYQNPNFKNKLRDARGYKREYKKIPEGRMGFFLSYLHLDSLLGKVIAFLLLLATAYVLFAPNFLTIKKIEVPNVSETARVEIKNSAKAFLASKPFWPQSNLLLLSKNGLAGYLVSKNRQTSKVVKIEKDFPSTLIIQINERFDAFLLKTPSATYIVSNDGQITRQLSFEDFNSTTSPYSTLIGLNLAEDRAFYEMQAVSDSAYFEAVDEILSRMRGEFQNPITAMNVESFERSDFEAKTQKGYIIKFDANSDLAKIFTQLNLLLKEVGDSRISGVKYIDMRIKDRGYVCYKDAACAQEASVINIATSTSQSIDQN